MSKGPPFTIYEMKLNKNMWSVQRYNISIPLQPATLELGSTETQRVGIAAAFTAPVRCHHASAAISLLWEPMQVALLTTFPTTYKEPIHNHIFSAIKKLH